MCIRDRKQILTQPVLNLTSFYSPEFMHLSTRYIHDSDPDHTPFSSHVGIPDAFRFLTVNCLCEKTPLGVFHIDGYKMSCPALVRSPKCLVYSLGSHGNFAYELAVYRHFECEIFTFDLKNYSAPPFVTFTRAKIGTCVGCTRLTALMEHHGHQEREVDMFKIDIDGFEWQILDEVFDDRFTQIQMEIHNPRIQDILKLGSYSDRFCLADIAFNLHAGECLELLFINKKGAERAAKTPRPVYNSEYRGIGQPGPPLSASEVCEVPGYKTEGAIADAVDEEDEGGAPVAPAPPVASVLANVPSLAEGLVFALDFADPRGRDSNGFAVDLAPLPSPVAAPVAVAASGGSDVAAPGAAAKADTQPSDGKADGTAPKKKRRRKRKKHGVKRALAGVELDAALDADHADDDDNGGDVEASVAGVSGRKLFATGSGGAVRGGVIRTVGYPRMSRAGGGSVRFRRHCKEYMLSLIHISEPTRPY